MRTFETVQNVVDNAIEFHRQAAALYWRLDERLSDPRARMLLDYMRGHHLSMEDNVERVKRGASESVLGTYLQYTLEETPRRYLENLVKDLDAPGTDEIGELGSRVDDYLVDLFEEALQEVDSAKAEEFLKDLLDLERLERRKLTLTLNSLQDM